MRDAISDRKSASAEKEAMWQSASFFLFFSSQSARLEMQDGSKLQPDFGGRAAWAFCMTGKSSKGGGGGGGEN